MLGKAIKVALIAFVIWYVARAPDRAGQTAHQLGRKAVAIVTQGAEAAASFLDSLTTGH